MPTNYNQLLKDLEIAILVLFHPFLPGAFRI